MVNNCLKLVGYLIKIPIVFIGIVILCSCSMVDSVSNQAQLDSPHTIWSPPLAVHAINDVTGLVQLWHQSNIFTNRGYLNSSPDLVAAEGKIFIIGSASASESCKLLAVDRLSQSVLWKKSPCPTAMYATTEALYIGGHLKISALDLQTADTIWTKRFLLKGPRNFGYIYAEEDRVFASGGIILDAKTGSDYTPFIPQPDDVYFIGSTELNNTMIFRRIRSGNFDLEAIDRETNEALWHTDENLDIISNVSANEAAVFFLTRDGRLLGLDAKSGKIVASVQFEPAPFITYSRDDQPGGYFVAVDKEEGLVYALLGDSRQLFAFEILAEDE